MQSSTFVLRFPVFANYDVTVIFTDNIRAVARRHNGRVSKNTAACFITKRSAPLSGWLVFSRLPNPDEIAHESWHCIFHLLKTVGAEIEDEVAAYHLGYLVGKIHQWRNEID